MAAPTAVFISRKLVPELWRVVLAEAPAGWTVDSVSPDCGEAGVAGAIAGAGSIVTFGSGPVPFSLFEPLRQLRIVQTTGQGTDHLPVRQLREQGVFVCNTGGGNATSVAEFTLLLILATLRRLPPLAASLRAGAWAGNSTMMNTHELRGKTLGIIGFGNIGRQVAHLAAGFGARVIFTAKQEVPDAEQPGLPARQVSLAELLAAADIVTLHVPSTEASRDLITAKELSLMKPTAYLINTARGAVVNEADLIRALHEKRIAGAGIDVWEPEPPARDNPLLHMDNVVATPHAGALAWENWLPRVRVIWGNLVRVSEGREPLNQVRDS